MTVGNDTKLKIFFSTRRFFIEACLFFAAAAAIILLATIPQIQAVFEYQNTIAREQPKLEQLEIKLQNLETVEVSEEFSKAGVVNQTLPSKKPLMELLISLQAAADRSETNIINFDLSPGELASASAQSAKTAKRGAADFDFVELNVELEGSFTDIQNFFNYVERFTPFTMISNVNLEPLQANQELSADSESLVTASMQIRTYYFTKSVQSTVDSTLPSLTQQNLDVLAEVETFVTIDVPEQQEIENGGNPDLFGGVNDIFN